MMTTAQTMEESKRAAFLTWEDRKAIHDSSIHILETIGAKFDNDEALDYLEKIGASVDREKKTAKFTKKIVEDAINLVPKEFVLEGRDHKNDIVVGSGQTYFLPFAVAVNSIDLDTGEYRLSTSEDMKKISILTDYLDEFNLTHNAVTLSDENPETELVHSMEINMNNCTKPIMCGMSNAEITERYIQMASVLAGGREELKEHNYLIGAACVVSPLTYAGDVLDSMMAFAKAGQPVRILSMALTGATCPCTIAATLAQQNAEILAGIVLLQAVTPGLPSMYATSSTLMDFRQCLATLGCAEMSIYSATTAEMAKFYKIPSFVAGG